jgi:spermidine synthase
MAPRITYAPDSLPRDRLVSLLGQLTIDPADTLAAGTNATTQQRIAAYWSARNRYIEIGREIQPSADVERMLAQVRAPLLSVLHTSPDFRPAYDPLVMMAGALAQVDAGAARSLLRELSAIQPAWPEAAQTLRELANASH